MHTSSSSSPFDHLLVGLENRVPQTLRDLDDAIIVTHWMKDVLHSVFGNNEDSAFISEEYDPNKDAPFRNYTELFCTNNILREYHRKDCILMPWVILEDNKNRKAIGRYSTLKSALISLVILDTKVSVEKFWNNSFSGRS